MLVFDRGLSPALAGLPLTAGALGWSTGSWLQARPWLRMSRPGLLVAGGALVSAGVGLWRCCPRPGGRPG